MCLDQFCFAEMKVSSFETLGNRATLNRSLAESQMRRLIPVSCCSHSFLSLVKDRDCKRNGRLSIVCWELGCLYVCYSCRFVACYFVGMLSYRPHWLCVWLYCFICCSVLIINALAVKKCFVVHWLWWHGVCLSSDNSPNQRFGHKSRQKLETGRKDQFISQEHLLNWVLENLFVRHNVCINIHHRYDVMIWREINWRPSLFPTVLFLCFKLFSRVVLKIFYN